MAKRLMSVKEAGAYLGITTWTLYSWVSQGKIPSVKLGSRRLFDVQALDRFIAKNTHQGRVAT